jgi:hypothetical protein
MNAQDVGGEASVGNGLEGPSTSPEPGSRAAQLEADSATRNLGIYAVNKAEASSGMTRQYDPVMRTAVTPSRAWFGLGKVEYLTSRPDSYTLIYGRTVTDEGVWGSVRGATVIGGIDRTGRFSSAHYKRLSEGALGASVYVKLGKPHSGRIYVFEHGRSPWIIPK